jgi:lactoylglutathione lyase
MKIEHLALWVRDLERSRTFYHKYFKGISGEIYVNTKNQFSSYFMSFEGGARLELMHSPNVVEPSIGQNHRIGITHFAISVGSKEIVDRLTEEIRDDGFAILGEPRTTGDGYYESVVADPDGNRVEITV